MATNENTNDEELGGALMHSRISGVADFLAEDENEAITIARDIVKNLKINENKNETGKVLPPKYKIDELLGIIPVNLKKSFDVREVIVRIVDNSDFFEFKENYGISIVCCWASINGYPLGIIANNGVILKKQHKNLLNLFN